MNKYNIVQNLALHFLNTVQPVVYLTTLFSNSRLGTIVSNEKMIDGYVDRT